MKPCLNQRRYFFDSDSFVPKKKKKSLNRCCTVATMLVLLATENFLWGRNWTSGRITYSYYLESCVSLFRRSDQWTSAASSSCRLYEGKTKTWQLWTVLKCPGCPWPTPWTRGPGYDNGCLFGVSCWSFQRLDPSLINHAGLPDDTAMLISYYLCNYTGGCEI